MHVLIFTMNRKNSTPNITEIKCSLQDTDHFQPKSFKDFDPRKIYYAKWTCELTCLDEHEHFDYYPCYIINLGESRMQLKEIEETTRNKIPKIVQDFGELPNSQKKKRMKVYLLRSGKKKQKEMF
ncbi:uncharacterized protein LOC107981238 [Nasonia vitripennis]|uniref:Uncharacterized protein n=1 Tax=Nasonia vitripennis TaxID=7425 RepID=A0A7M7ISI2_NASVI|nr:uncharacterized protein LOC107981238 [Nasonia vitripennis]